MVFQKSHPSKNAMTRFVSVQKDRHTDRNPLRAANGDTNHASGRGRLVN